MPRDETSIPEASNEDCSGPSDIMLTTVGFQPRDASSWARRRSCVSAPPGKRPVIKNNMEWDMEGVRVALHPSI
jgi:hypothetical protein